MKRLIVAVLIALSVSAASVSIVPSQVTYADDDGGE